MQQARANRRSDPQATIAIPKQSVTSELLPSRKRISFSSPGPQLCDTAILGNKEFAVVAFDQSVDSERRVWHWIELRWTRLPSPEPGHPSRPEIASAILIQGGHS